MKTVIVDVRTRKEFSEGSYPGAINLPSNEFKADQYLEHRNNHIALVCYSGNRASQVLSRLYSEGFTNVFLMNHQMVHFQKGSEMNPDIWTVDRQFRLALGLLLGVFIFWNYILDFPLSLGILLVVFVGLLYSAITDNCYLKELITRLPWNRTQ